MKVQFLLLAIVLAFFTACGSSGGGSVQNASQSIEELKLQNSNPSDGATNVALNSKISLNFNYDLKQSSVKLKFSENNTDVPYPISVNKSALIISPTSNLKKDTTYTLEVSQLESLTGNKLKNPISISFTTTKGINFANPTRSVNVVENQTSALTLSANGTNITYTISGGDSNEFDLNDKTGVVSFKTAPDYESTKKSYTFIASASDGIDSATQDITINITNDTSDDLHPPVLSATTFTNVYSLNPIDTIIGKVNITSGASTITSFTLSGTKADDFSIELNGDVKIAKALDFATKPVYNLKVKATNSKGDSNKVDLKIKLIDKAILSAFVQDSQNSSSFRISDKTTKKIQKSADGSKAYVINDIKFKILDISDMTNVKTLASFSGHSWNDFAISNDENTAYLIKNGYLLILDISNKSNITQLAKLDFTNTSLQYITLNESKNKLYIGNNEYGAVKIHTVDISDKTNPVKSSEISFSTYIDDIKIFNNKLYVANGGKLFTYDLKSDGKIDEASKTTFLSQDIRTFSIVDDKVFCLNYNKNLEIYNLNTKALLGSVLLSSFFDGKTALKISKDKKKAYIGTYRKKFYIVDISDVTNPKIILNEDYPAEIMSLEPLNPETILIGSRSGSLDVKFTSLTPTPFISSVDVGSTVRSIKLNKDKTKAFVGTSNSLNKIELSSTPMSKDVIYSGQLIGMTLVNDKAFISIDHTDEVKLLDISTSPATVLNTISITKAGTLKISHDKKYLFVQRYTDPRFIDIYDISDPLNPILKKADIPIGSFSSECNILLSSDDNTLFVGRKVYDISDKANPVELNSYSLYGSDTKAIVGNYLYARKSWSEFAIFDISDIKNPQKLSSLGKGKKVIGTQDENIIYFVDNKGTYTYDVSDKSNPKKINSIATSLSDVSDDLKTGYGNIGNSFVKLDLTLATLYKRKNFGSSEIKLIINDNLGKDISVSASVDSAGIVNLGTVATPITQSEYQGKIVSIPITAITDKTGTTVISITLDDGVNSITKKVYLNII